MKANLAFGIQAVILNFANVMLAQPTVVNIIYSSRGLFGITHTWFIGHWFGNRERQEVGTAMMIRALHRRLDADGLNRSGGDQLAADRRPVGRRDWISRPNGVR